MANGPSLDLIHTFVRVADGESLSGAAKRLRIPKSTVSRRLERLENELGVRLVQRTPRSVALTDAGRNYYEQAREHIDSLLDATRAVGQSQTEIAGEIRITAPIDFGQLFLPRLVARFTGLNPAVVVEISLSNEVVNYIEESFDIGIRAGKLQDSTLIARKLVTSSMGLFASRSYLAQHEPITHPEDLTDHACVLFRARGGTALWPLEWEGVQAETPVAGNLGSDDFGTLCALVKEDGGVGLIPTFMGNAHNLERILPQISFPAGPISVVVPTLKNIAPRVEAMRQFLIDEIPKQPGLQAP